MSQIGERQDVIIVEPVENPVPQQDPAQIPEREPEKEPVGAQP